MTFAPGTGAQRFEKWIFMTACLAVPCFALSAARSNTAPDPDETRLLAADTIHISTTENILASMRETRLLLSRDTNLLEEAQSTYATLLPPGEQPEFVVRMSGPGAYYYVNRHNERSEIREVWRHVDSTNTVALSFYVKGERFFGDFESLIHLSLRESGTNTVACRTDVYAYPHSGWLRGLLHLPLINNYFAGKTRDMTSLFLRIVERMSKRLDLPRASQPVTLPVDPENAFNAISYGAIAARCA